MKAKHQEMEVYGQAVKFVNAHCEKGKVKLGSVFKVPDDVNAQSAMGCEVIG